MPIPPTLIEEILLSAIESSLILIFADKSIDEIKLLFKLTISSSGF